MKKILGFVSLSIASLSFGQNSCFIDVVPTVTTICPGDSTLIVVNASLLPAGQTFNFNGSSLPPGWSTTGTTYFSSPCGSSLDGTPYYWAATAGSTTPTITTAAFDISCPGGTVQFDMVYSVQGDPSPCEGPDQQNEGVQLQYSTDGGATWTLILYYEPDGQTLTSYNTSTATVIGTGQQTAFTTWNTYSVPIPPGANSPSTQFRWIQVASSSSANDNWGLDNVIINAYGGTCSDTYNLLWSNGLTADSAYITTYADSTFTIDVYDTLGNYQCSSALIQVLVYPDNLTYTAVDTVYSACPTTNPQVTISNISSAHGPYSVNWPEIPSTNTTVNLSTGGAEHDTLVYHFTVEDGCQFTRNDSVVLIVNKTLNIDSMQTYPASACKNDGAVVAFVSGQTINGGVQPFYNWNGPGATNPAFINGTAWDQRSPGWYYFFVQDAVCTDYDSIEVTQLPPPSAGVNADPDAGCAPFTTTLTNTSQNANQYYWDFGNGQTTSVTNTNSQTQTYSDTATVMLVASMDGDCPDTAYVSVYSAVCGCTDSTALNYNPLAMINDGSCQYAPVGQPAVVIPNVFTPNGDGVNDVFELTLINVTSVSFTILNRWGDVIYEASPSSPKWDGKDKNGVKVNDGVYFVVYKVVGLTPELTLDGQGFVEVFTTK